jgi:hypothetical protein
MAATQLNVLLIDGSTVIVVPIPPSLALNLPGLSPVDNMVRTIMVRGYFWNVTDTVAYPTSQIKSITWQ